MEEKNNKVVFAQQWLCANLRTHSSAPSLGIIYLGHELFVFFFFNYNSKIKCLKMGARERKRKKNRDMNAIVLIYAEKHSSVDSPHLLCYMEPNWS